MSFVSDARHGFRLRLRVRMWLTTALIGCVPGFWVTNMAWAQSSELYLDNGDMLNAGTDPVSGTWAAGDAIWSGSNGKNHSALPVGGAGVLGPSASGTVLLNVDGTVQPGTLRFKGGGYTLDGGRIEDSGDGLTLRVDRNLLARITSEIAGALAVEGWGVLQYSGDGVDLTSVDIASGATLEVTGTTAGLMTNDGHLVLSGTQEGNLDNNNRATLADGAINGAVVNDGVLIGGGTISGALTNRDTARIAGVVSGTVDNAGTLTTTGDLDVGVLTNSGTTTVTSGDVLSSGSTVANSGTINIRGKLDADLNNGQTVNLAGGTVTGIVVNDGTLTGQGALDGTLDNSGTVSLRGDVGGAVVNDGTLSLTGTMASLTNMAAGEANLRGAVTGALENEGTLTTIGNLNVGSLTNNGIATISTGNRLQSDTTVANEGEMTIAGTLSGGLDAGSSATTILDGGTVNGALNNSGELSGSGLVDGVLTNDGNMIVASGDRVRSTQTMVNNGTLSLAGDLVTGLNNGTTGNAALTGGSIGGAVTNDGVLAGTGTLASLTNNASADLGGAVTGGVTNSGSLTVAGDLNVGGLTNTGTVTIDDAETLSARRTVSNSGTLEIAGTLAGAVMNATGGVVDLTDGAVTGTVTNAGDLSGSGTLASLTNTGTANLTGTVMGDLTNRATATLTGTVGGQVTNSGVLAGTGSFGSVTNEARGTADLAGTVSGVLNNAGLLSMTGDLSVDSLNNSGALTIDRDETLSAAHSASNSGTLEIAGTLAGAMTNAASGVVDLADGAITGAVTNAGDLSGSGTLASLTNTGTADLIGTVTGDMTNRAAATLTGTIGGQVTNSGVLAGVGSFGSIANETNGTADLAGTVHGALDNAGTLTTTGDLNVASLMNSGTAEIATRTTLQAISGATNDGTMSIAGTLQGTLTNTADAIADLAGGSVDGALTNSGTLSGNGSITGNVNNSGTATLAGTISGDMTNSGTLTTSGLLDLETLMNSGRTEIVAGGSINTTSGADNSGTLTLAGTLEGDIANTGNYTQSGTLTGDLTSSAGTAALAGVVGGDVTVTGGTLTVADGLNIAGALDIGVDLSVASGNTITTGETMIRSAGNLALNGTLEGAVTNNGTIRADGASSRINGSVVNDGLITLVDGAAGSQLIIASDSGGLLDGSGSYELDVDVVGLQSDLITLSNVAVSGAINLTLNYLGGTGTQQLGSTTLVRVDPTQNSTGSLGYTVAAQPTQSERFVYSVTQSAATGDLTFNAGVNNAYGTLAGNVALTQSLIGSVINRPTSPYVVNLAYEDAERPCGPGGWGRAVGGWAQSSGATDNGTGRVSSHISADYYGMQFGGDMACFGEGFGGWNGAVGVIGGVNHGKSSQPVYLVDPTDPNRLLSTMSSINKSDFNQFYGGVYLTASKGAFLADMQLRGERTNFDVRNNAVIAGGGLGFDKSSFSSNGFTLSGSMSYAFPLGPNGWQVVPTMGFAWSQMSTDPMKFNDGYRLDFEDAERKVGFAGGTVSRTFVQEAENAALNLFATGTYYKDFADPLVTRFWNENDSAFEAQRLVSDNLGAYGELSIGANYVRILSPGRAGRPRQFSTSARIDKRFSDDLDSVGVTGQIRWQF
ncbi:MAG: hypothetical protein Q4G24_15120 [Paracoccus sp. (in: a-proteobacteria)]|uniref:hypothetical protein n=1 Tax=Paracoccus sp. TaxID=267 RepID=UPI0026DF65BD|nr:hypothetical protein [Paracoccus sp. (in: a-proteobacteria)]MDO5622784.1 hypothetical protein [Paracoccus sp. (in: a-proteobacteria)]